MKIVLFIIKIYRSVVSPVFVPIFGHGCRFTPSCSEYAEGAISRHGLADGLKLTVRRLGKCQPFYRGETIDPVV
jgi:uncharacterized protein